MSGNTGWRVLTQLLAAIALAGCDENATTAPEEPVERVVEAEPPSWQWADHIEIAEFELTELFPDGSQRVHRGGSVYNFASAAARNAVFPPDAEALRYIPSLRDYEIAPIHKTANWNDFEICAECGLVLTEVVRLGDADGPGIIESDAPRVTWSEQMGYVVVGRTFPQLFDDDGRFVRRIGRKGEGPGEFGGIADAHVVGGRLVVLDRVRRSWSIFDRSGQFVGRRPYGHQTGPFVPVGGDRVAVVARDRSSQAGDSPLHLAHVDSGVPSLHFGSREVWEYDRRDRPFSDIVRGSVVGQPGAVWWGAAGSPRVQEWSIDDELLRVIEGDLPWFPEVTEPVDRTREPPPTLLGSLALEGQNRFWMITRTADPDWRDVELEPGPEGLRIPASKRADYLDTRLDIFDLEEQRHIGRYVWDSPYPRLFNLGGEPAVSVVEYNEDKVPQVVIYRVGRDGVEARNPSAPPPVRRVKRV